MPGIAPPTPYQWSVTDVASAALLNAQLYNLATFLLQPPMFFAIQQTAQSIPNSTFTNLLFDTEIWDTENGHITTSNSQRYNIPYSGKYRVDGCASFANNGTGFRALKVVANNAATGIAGSERSCAAIGGFDTTISLSTTVQVNAGDFLTLQTYQNSGGALSTDTSSPAYEYVTSFAVTWVGL